MLHILSNSLMTATRMNTRESQTRRQVMAPEKKDQAHERRRKQWLLLGGLMP